jgi:hypothetical protein
VFFFSLRSSADVKRRQRPATRPAIRRLRLESLEERSLPSAATFTFSTGAPDGRMATASRPASAGAPEIESADDFILANETNLTQATFTGLVPAHFHASNVLEADVEINRLFPDDSNTTRTPHVPTRVNSPSDVEFTDRDSSKHSLKFSTEVLDTSFTAANSVRNGIFAAPHQTTGGQGPLTGEEVQFDLVFSKPLNLPAGHYFFVPQVRLKSGNFYWLSTPHKQFAGDLQEWIRDDKLEPDWLRVGTDIVGGTTPPTFDAAFSLTGETV